MNISIIAAVYNGADTLEEALESVQAQTWTAWECIVVNDGSTDATTAIVERFAEQDDRFRLIRRKTNGGVCTARNQGIAEARYDFVIFLDADDWYLPEQLDRMAKILKEDDSLDAVYCGYLSVTPDGYSVFRIQAEEKGDIFERLGWDCPMCVHSCLVKRELLEEVGGFDSSFTVAEDWDLYQRIARLGARFGIIEDMYVPYRMFSNSASTNGHQILVDSLRVLEQGVTPDPRVRPHPAFPEGLPKDDLVKHKFDMLCTAAGLVIGRGKDALDLLEELKDCTCSTLEPKGVAECTTEAILYSACQPLSMWVETLDQARPLLDKFLEALETHSHCPNLKQRIGPIPEQLVAIYMEDLGLLYRLRAFKARAILTTLNFKPLVIGAVQRRAWYLLERVKVVSKMVPMVDRRVHAILRHYHVENRDDFEGAFADEADPWHYTSDYEQKKYQQTLEMLPDGPIEDALELACAEGHFTVQLAPLVKRLVAADITQLGVDRTAQRCKDFSHVSFQRLDLIKDPLPGRYDLIVCSEVLYCTGTFKQLRKVARKLVQALQPGGHLVMAHANLVIEDPDQAGFRWNIYPFGAKGIGQTFAEQSELNFIKELCTPLYRVQLFKKEKPTARVQPQLITMEQPTDLPPEVASQVLWHGCTDQLPILMYHRVAPDGSKALAPYRVAPKEFEEQLSYLRDAGYCSVTLEEWREWVDWGLPLPKGAICLTFDDGYMDFYEHAWPLLKRYNFSATVFLVADRIGHTNTWDREYGETIPLMNWPEIRQLQSEGITFGCHSATHPSLTSIPFSAMRRELERSKNILEEGLSVTVNTLSYPFGEYNLKVQYIAGLYGFETAVTDNEWVCTESDSLLALPRFDIGGSDSFETFVSKVEGKFEE